MALAGFAACLPRAADWPFVVSMGGYVGGGVAGIVISPFQAMGLPGASIIAAVLLLPLGAWGIAHAMGVTREHVEAALDAFFWCYDVAEEWVLENISRLKARYGKSEEREEPVFEDQGELDLEEETDEDIYDAYEDEEDAFEDGEEELEPKRKIIREVRKVPTRRPVEETQKAFDPDDYQLPSLNLLKAPNPDDARVVSDDELEERARMLETVLADFKVHGEIINVRPGPVVTLYELEPAAGVKSSRVIGLADDIARSMSAIACRVAVVPGRNAIGIELPNDDREFVLFHEMLSAPDFEASKGLTLALGKDIGGEPQYADLAKMPHLLIAGTTGSGKSVGINTMILSLLYRLPPDQCKLIMVDPKMLELSVYEGIPHLLAPVVTDPHKAVVALKWTVREMEERYKQMSKVGVRNIHGFNERIEAADEKGEELSRKVHTGYDSETGEPTYEEEVLDHEKMPFIVVVIDEVADLMMVAGKDIEAMVQRLAQMARA
ncbi:MAG: DNA translocase FtsK, partial [Pseudomonadota bacterium]